MKKKNIPNVDSENEQVENISDSSSDVASKLNAEELEAIRTRYDELGEDRSKIPPPENKKQSKIVRFAKKNTVATVIISVFAIALFASVILLIIYAVNNSNISESKKDFIFTFGEDEEVRVKYSDAVINDVLYVDMNKLAEYAEMSVSGSAETMKYIASGDNYIKFTNDSEYCVINASKVSIPSPAIIEDGKCLVPYTVISDAVNSGLSFKSSRVKNTVEIKRTTYKQDDIVYNNDITFSSEKFTVVQSIKSTAGIVFEYHNDVTDILQYIDPQDNTPYLLLVNPDNPLPETYVPVGLTALPTRYTAGTENGDTYALQYAAQQAMTALIKDMADEAPSNGAYITSAYRSYEDQVKLFEGYIKDYEKKGYSREEAEKIVLQTSARPGTSEHQSGLCADFITKEMKTLNNADFEKSRAFEWLSQNAYKYGFILRYPKDKTDITNYSYESWHYRFVGREAAAEIYFSNLCLEEYLQLL